MNNKSIKNLFSFGTACLILLSTALAQNPAPVVKTEIVRPANVKPLTDKQVIDSLRQVIAMKDVHMDSVQQLLEDELAVSADLREQMIKLDDYRKKLEDNVNSFKGENLKLNQSNRILIVFNSLVAVLLITSLVFFLRKIGKKQSAAVASASPGITKQGNHNKYVNFEDKLLQLERLGSLREKGLLSEEEFVVEKQKVLEK